MYKKVNILLNKCESCGNDKIFDPDRNCLFCVSCNTHTQIKAESGLFKHALNRDDKLMEHKNQEWLNQNHSMQCPNCGAQTVLKTYQTSAKCPYCETSLIMSQEHFAGLKPDSIIPFKFGKQNAERIFKEELKKKWFVSKKFKNSIKADEIKALYFPSFIFDADCVTHYEGVLYKDESKTDSKGNRKTSRKYFTISGTTQTKHTNIEIEASSKLSQYELNSIKPYNFNEAKKYVDEFIFGYSLENYCNSLSETNSQAMTIIKKDIEKKILSDYSYDGVQSLTTTMNFSNEKFSYCVLPMYRINYKHKNKQYSNIMNGQTGKLGGNYPKSALKITFVVLLSLLLVAIPILLIMFL